MLLRGGGQPGRLTPHFCLVPRLSHILSMFRQRTLRRFRTSASIAICAITDIVAVPLASHHRGSITPCGDRIPSFLSILNFTVNIRVYLRRQYLTGIDFQTKASVDLVIEKCVRFNHHIRVYTIPTLPTFPSRFSIFDLTPTHLEALHIVVPPALASWWRHFSRLAVLTIS